MSTRKIVRTAGILVAALAVAGGVVAATAYAAGVTLTPLAATTPTPTTKPSPNPKASAYCDKFTQHLAADLKTSQSNVQAQIKKAAGQTIDDAVKSGDLTQAQADKLKQRLDAGTLCSGSFAGIGRKPEGGTAARQGEGVMQAALNAAATTLNTTPAQLKQELGQGKSLSQIAPAGMTEDQFKSQFSANLKTELDQQVSAGKLTQAQETQILSAAPNLIDRLWNQGMPMRPAKPQPTPTPTT
jgi:hypothetical protein